MADGIPPDHNLSSDSPTHLNVPHDLTANMSVDSTSSDNAGESAPLNGDTHAHATSGAPPVQPADPNAKQVNEVITSEIGVAALLQRLKQSIASAKEFAAFLKKRSILEEDHANGLRKLCRTTQESVHRPEHRQGSFVRSYDEVTKIHERMAENGLQFAGSLIQMHDDLHELTTNIERGRKQWKTQGLNAEQRLVDTEAAMRKSKAKYDSLAEEYDRARTGERASGKIFGLKGPKSAQQHEEDLQRKLATADNDYASKVQIAQSTRTEISSKTRPEAVKALQDLIRECDAALSMQMQKFAAFNEKLLLSNGLSISPLKKDATDQSQRSLREAVAAINNDRDLSDFISSFASKVPPKPAEIKYEKHPSLTPQPLPQSQPPMQRQPDLNASYASRQGPPAQPSTQKFPSQPPSSLQAPPGPQSFSQGPPPQQSHHERNLSNSYNQVPPGGPQGSMNSRAGPVNSHPQSYGASSIPSAPPQLSQLPFQTSSLSDSFQQKPSSSGPQSYPQPGSRQGSAAVPRKPVFGISLEQLFERDNSAVPMVVYQCIQAIDLYGLEVEGIYRLSGTATHIQRLKDMFDHDPTSVDFRNPEAFYHDVNSVAGLLKQFFRELPDPLLTIEHYAGFVDAAKIEDDVVRRDSLHAIINNLPDPNYATLRALALHLNRVQQNSSINRMNSSNLAIVFGPTLMTGQNINDAGWQVRVVETILSNTLQIFDDD